MPARDGLVVSASCIRMGCTCVLARARQGVPPPPMARTAPWQEEDLSMDQHKCTRARRTQQLLPTFTSACGTSVRSRLAGFGAMWILQPFSIGCPLTNVCLHNVFAIVSQRDGGVVGGPTSSGGDGGAAGSEGAWEEAKVSYCAILAVSANRLQCHQKGI